MLIENIRNIPGPNVFSHMPVLVATLDLQDLYKVESYQVPGFIDRLLELLTERPDSPAYVALPPHILQRGGTALVLAGSAVHVTRRSPQGWRYVISWLGE